MGILIEQRKGFRTGDDGKPYEVELPVDDIFLTGKEYPVPKCVAYAMRHKDAGIGFIMPVSESDEAAIRKAVAQREYDGGDAVEREVSVAPQIKQTGKK